MKKYIFLFFLISVGIMIHTDSIASDKHSLITFAPQIELKSVSSSDGAYKTAGVCFLGVGECDNLNDYLVDSKNQCLNEGFTKDCPTGYHPEIGKDCIHNPDYKKCCKETCPINSSVDCTGAETGPDGCGYACKKCCVTSCPSGYTASIIPNGYVQDGEACMHCTQGIKYKIKANSCDGFSTCQYGATSGTSTCLSGTTIKYASCKPCSEDCPYGTQTNDPGGCGGSARNECDTKNCFFSYQACCTDECPGYNSSGRGYSCAYGSDDCYDSCGESWWHNCKSAPPPDPCDSLSAVSAPSNASCSSTYSNCSSKCSGWSCNSGYSKSVNSCVKDTPAANPCDSVTAVSVPSNASCSSYHSSCSSKCSGWSCNSGYSKSVNSCVKDAPACTPYSNESGCSLGTKNCDNGCGGTRQCCKYCGDFGLSSNCGTYEKCNKSSSYHGCGTCVPDRCKESCYNAQQNGGNTGDYSRCMSSCGTSIHC